MTIFGKEDFNQGELYLLREKSKEEFYQAVMLDNLIELCAGIQNAYNAEVFCADPKNSVCFYCSQENVREELRREITEINLGIKEKISPKRVVTYLKQTAKCLQRLFEYTANEEGDECLKPGSPWTIRPKVIDFCANLSILETAAEFFDMANLNSKEQRTLKVLNSQRCAEYQAKIAIKNLTKIPSMVGKQRLIMAVQIRIGARFPRTKSFFYRFVFSLNDFFSLPLIKTVTEETRNELTKDMVLLIPKHTPFVDTSFVEDCDESFFQIRGGIFSLLVLLETQIKREKKLNWLMSIRYLRDPEGLPPLGPESLVSLNDQLFLTENDEGVHQVGTENNTMRIFREENFLARMVKLTERKDSRPISVVVEQYDMLTKTDGVDKILFKQDKKLKLCLGECMLFVKQN